VSDLTSKDLLHDFGPLGVCRLCGARKTSFMPGHVLNGLVCPGRVAEELNRLRSLVEPKEGESDVE